MRNIKETDAITEVVLTHSMNLRKYFLKRIEGEQKKEENE